MNARFIRLSYTIIFVIIAIISLITLGITASLVSKYNKDGYPPEHTNSYRDRIRLLLVGSVWTTFFAREYDWLAEYVAPPAHLRGSEIWATMEEAGGGVHARNVGDLRDGDGTIVRQCKAEPERGREANKLRAPDPLGAVVASGVGTPRALSFRPLCLRLALGTCHSTLAIRDTSPRPSYAPQPPISTSPRSTPDSKAPTHLASRLSASAHANPQSSSKSASSSSATARSGAFFRT